MSSSFIGSKIAIITKSQCRYTGTIIGIDAQASSIILGNVKCYGTENRGGNFSNNAMVGTIVPIMQFANSDIEDLKIVEEDPMPILTTPTPPVPPPPPPAPQKKSSIHDDPAIVSAVVSSARLTHDLQHLNLSDEQSKSEESRIRPDSGEVGASWSVFSSHRADPLSSNRSKFFDAPHSDHSQSTRPQQQQRWPSNTHSTQTSRQNDQSGLPVRQPFFSNQRYQNGNMPQQQRYGYNNRRPVMNQARRPGGGNRETFHDNGNNYDDDFDFETSNQKFNKLASEDEFKQQSDSPSQFLPSIHHDSSANTEYEPIYDKKKSFFDHITPEETSDVQAPMYNRSRNHDTFGYDRNTQQRNRGGGGGGYRRSNNRYQQQGNEDFYHRQNNNGYHYRY